MPGMPVSGGWRLDCEGREMQGGEALGRRSRKVLGRQGRQIPGRQGSALKKAAALVVAASLVLGGAVTSLAEEAGTAAGSQQIECRAYPKLKTECISKRLVVIWLTKG